MPPGRLSDKQRRIWAAEIGLAREYSRNFIETTRMYAEATKDNEEHWKALRWNKSYERVTANYMYANLQATLPRVLMRCPKVIVRPATRMTRAYQRTAADSDPVKRFVAAAVAQQIVNWRVREFDFAKQWRRGVRDDWQRGFGVIRHGYMAEGDKTTQKNGKHVEFENHTHLR